MACICLSQVLPRPFLKPINPLHEVFRELYALFKNTCSHMTNPTYIGRVKHFVKLTNPMNLFVSVRIYNNHKYESQIMTVDKSCQKIRLFWKRNQSSNLTKEAKKRDCHQLNFGQKNIKSTPHFIPKLETKCFYLDE